MKKPGSNKGSAPPSQTPSPQPIKKMSATGSPQKMQSTSTKQSETVKGPESQKQASPAQKTPETQRAVGSQKSPQTGLTVRKQSGATPAPQQESGGLFGFGGPKKEAAKPEVTGKMFGFGSSIFSSASTLIASAVQDEPKTTPPVSPKMQLAKDTKPPSVSKSEQEKKQEQHQQGKAHPAVQAKVEKSPSQTQKAAEDSQHASKGGKSTCPICKVVLNVGLKDPPNYNTCTECKNTVCNQCGFNPMPNVKEVRCLLCIE